MLEAAIANVTTGDSSVASPRSEAAMVHFNCRGRRRIGAARCWICILAAPRRLSRTTGS